MNKSRLPTDWTAASVQRRTRRRYAAERRFRLTGLAAVWLSAAFLAFLLASMVWQGMSGFRQTRVALPIDFAAARLAVTSAQVQGRGADLALAGAGLEAIVDRAATQAFGPDGAELISDGAWRVVRDAVKRDPAMLRGRATIAVPVASALDVAAKHDGTPAAEAAVAR